MYGNDNWNNVPESQYGVSGRRQYYANMESEPYRNFQPVRDIARIFAEMQSAQAAAERVTA